MNRSCAEALIPIQFCTCVNKENIDEDRFLKETGDDFSYTAQVIVENLNKKIEHLKSKCAVFTVKSVKSVKKIIGEEKNIIFEFTILAEPGDALFKALIQIEDEAKIDLKSRISRENKYGKTSACLTGNEREFRDFCYCLDQN